MITWEWLIAIIGAAVGVAGLWSRLRNTSRAENRGEGVMQSDIGYIKGGIDDLKKEMRDANSRHYGLAERVTKNEARTEQAHERIDALERK